jgi:hypothetical protein
MESVSCRLVVAGIAGIAISAVAHCPKLPKTVPRQLYP